MGNLPPAAQFVLGLGAALLGVGILFLMIGGGGRRRK
jgi:hypothetical protein